MVDSELLERFRQNDELLQQLILSQRAEGASSEATLAGIRRFTAFALVLLLVTLGVLAWQVQNSISARHSRNAQYQQSAERQEAILKAYADSKAQLADAAIDQQVKNVLSGECQLKSKSVSDYKSCIESLGIPYPE